jgi:hypothetical protein
MSKQRPSRIAASHTPFGVDERELLSARTARSPGFRPGRSHSSNSAVLINAVEVAAVEGDCPIKGGRFGRQPRKLDGVDLDATHRKRHRLPVCAHGVEAGLPEHLTDSGEGLLQAVARLRFGAVAPQQAGETVAGLGPSGRQREIGEQEFVLAGWQG